MRTPSAEIKGELKAATSRWLFIALLVGWPSSSEAQQFSARYDDEIQRAVKHYWPDLPIWRLWKAQLFQESRLDPNVCSAAGACGLAQFMGPTWTESLKRIGADAGASRFDARLSIEAGAYYQARMRTSWREGGRTGLARNDLGAASFNAGLGSILKAQALCNDARLWESIAPCVEQVTGPDHARETLGYVVNIRRWWKLMEIQ